MPRAAARTARTVAAELAATDDRQRELWALHARATAELADARARHGELFASGASEDETAAQARACAALTETLAGLAAGIARLNERRDALDAERRELIGREAMARAERAVEEYRTAVGVLGAHIREWLAADGLFWSYLRTLSDAVGETNATVSTAMELNGLTVTPPALDTGAVWRDLPPGTGALVETLHGYCTRMHAHEQSTDRAASAAE